MRGRDGGGEGPKRAITVSNKPGGSAVPATALTDTESAEGSGPWRK